MSLLIIILVLLLLAAVLYWQLVIAEGAYLGRRIVALLYDLIAHRYNKIKQYTAEEDARFLGVPLALSLQGIANPLVLDVATGTSRLPLALFLQPTFHGTVIALDNARRMLHEATEYLRAYRDRITWVCQDAVPLPFDDDTFDVVTCLEALEFMPDTPEALTECVRVLKPGGILLATNRIATGAKLMPGKTFSKERFEALLQALGQIEVTTQLWQYDYDLVWSIKPDDESLRVSAAQPRSAPGGPPTFPWKVGHGQAERDKNPTGLIELLRCPHGRHALTWADNSLVCSVCLRRYPIERDGVIEML